MRQDTEPQVTAAAEAEADMEAAPQEAQPAVSFPAGTVEALAQALEDAQVNGEAVDALAEAANSEAIKAEIIGDEATGRVLMITAEPENIVATTQIETDALAKKPTGKGRGEKGAAASTDIWEWNRERAFRLNGRPFSLKAAVCLAMSFNFFPGLRNRA